MLMILMIVVMMIVMMMMMAVMLVVMMVMVVVSGNPRLVSYSGGTHHDAFTALQKEYDDLRMR